MTGYVLASGLKAIAESRGKTVAVAESMDEGTLFGLNAQGKAVKATQLAGSVVKPIGVVYEGSVREWGEGFVEDPNRPLNTKSYVDIISRHRIGVAEGTFTIADVASQKPVYLGLAGEFTTTVPTGTGTFKKIVGVVVGQSTVEIDLMRDLGVVIV